MITDVCAPSREGLSTQPWKSLALHEVEVFLGIVAMIGLAGGRFASKIGLMLTSC